MAHPAMMPMPPMIAYTVLSTALQNNPPSVIIGAGANKTWLVPASPQDDSYWFVFMDAKNPRAKVREWVQPGRSNATVPQGIDTFINDPDYLFS